MARILIVEDEEQIARFIELELQHEGYETAKAADGRLGLEMAQSGEYELVLLDIMLPELNGLEVLRRLRKASSVPVILLTARDNVSDKVAGLDTGANDYITKPFAIEELLARIRTVLRAPQKEAKAPVLEHGQLSLNVSAHTVSYAGTAVDLTKKEFALLQALLENKDIVLSRETLLERVWGYEYMGETNVVDVYVRYLRSKIDAVHGCNTITTVRGVGYVIKSEG